MVHMVATLSSDSFQGWFDYFLSVEYRPGSRYMCRSCREPKQPTLMPLTAVRLDNDNFVNGGQNR
jgi:hypothetical protein